MTQRRAGPPISSVDPDDDYLLAEAVSQRTFLVPATSTSSVYGRTCRSSLPRSFVIKLRQNG